MLVICQHMGNKIIIIKSSEASWDQTFIWYITTINIINSA